MVEEARMKSGNGIASLGPQGKGRGVDAGDWELGLGAGRRCWTSVASVKDSFSFLPWLH